MRPYLVAAPFFDKTNGGAMVLHKFAEALREKGQEVHLVQSNDPSYNYPDAPRLPDSIGVYPEITWGNPMNTKTVVRWVLNTPGKLRGPTEYPSTDLIFPFSELFNSMNLPNERVLFFPILDTDLFRDEGKERDKVAYYVGKGWRFSFYEETSQDSIEISRNHTLDQTVLKDLLNTCKVMYSYDNITAMTEIARLCGCPAVIVPNGEFTKEQYDKHEFGWNGLGWGKNPNYFNSAEFRQTYLSVREDFYKRLDYFIEVTQNA